MGLSSWKVQAEIQFTTDMPFGERESEGLFGQLVFSDGGVLCRRPCHHSRPSGLSCTWDVMVDML
ncbi:hypothetical protein AHAS_Ahas07G0062300 [Arachis hypogaea]